MRGVLVTGFEPFGGDSRNPSADIALALNGRAIAGIPVHGSVLPCVFGRSIAALHELLSAHQPEAVICLGVAGDRREITPERIAINLEDARIPDNAGCQPLDRPVVRGGPVALWSTLPIKAISEALQQAGFPASVSQTAGTFVCNHVFYGLMNALRATPHIRSGFIHVPFESPELPLQAMTAAITLAIETTLHTPAGIPVPGGNID